MKNIYKLLTIAVLMSIFFGCQTEDIEPSSEKISENYEIDGNSLSYDFEVEVKNNMLSFATREDYDKAIEFLGPLNSEAFAKWEESLDFVSMRNSFSVEQREKRGIVDDLLATLINPDAMIEIAGNVFKLDALNEKVSVVRASDYDNNTSLSGKAVTTFSTDDDVLDILEGTAERTSLTARRYCKKRHLSWNVQLSSVPNRIKAKVVYQKAGFLNSLQSKNKEILGISGTSSWNMGLETYGSNNFWRNKTSYGDIADRNVGIFNAANKSYRPYYSSRRLKSYRFSVKFTAQPKDGGSLRSKIVTIDCN